MLTIGSGQEATPTILFRTALHQAAPDLFQPGDRNRANLTIRPRPTHEWTADEVRANTDAWYDLVWTHPALEDTDHGYHDEPVTTVVDHPINLIGTLPPPPRIPVEVRAAAAGPVGVDHITDAQAALYGGREALQASWTAQRDAAWRADRSAEAWDWAAYVQQILPRLRELLANPPKLTAGQRAQVAQVRLHEAQARVDAEEQSVTAHLANAEKAGEPVRGPGRPSIGGKAGNVALGDDLLRRVDEAAGAAGVTRAEMIRTLVAAGLDAKAAAGAQE